MKLKRIPIILTISAALYVVLMGIHPSTSFAESDDDQGMVGTWQVIMTPETTGVPSTFIALVMFGREGTVLSVDHWGISYLGEWKHSKARDHTYTSNGMFYSGLQYYIFSISGKLTLNNKGTEFTGSFKTKIQDTNGAQIAIFNGTTKGKRIKVE